MVLWSLSGAVSGVWCGALELRRVRSFAPPGSRRPGSIRHRVPERTMGVQQSMGSTTTTPRGLPRRSRSNQARDCGVNPAPVRVPCSGSTAPAALLRIHAARNSLLRTHCSGLTAPNSLLRIHSSGSAWKYFCGYCIKPTASNLLRESWLLRNPLLDVYRSRLVARVRSRERDAPS